MTDSQTKPAQAAARKLRIAAGALAAGALAVTSLAATSSAHAAAGGAQAAAQNDCNPVFGLVLNSTPSLDMALGFANGTSVNAPLSMRNSSGTQPCRTVGRNPRIIRRGDSAQHERRRGCSRRWGTQPGERQRRGRRAPQRQRLLAVVVQEDDIQRHRHLHQRLQQQANHRRSQCRGSGERQALAAALPGQRGRTIPPADQDRQLLLNVEQDGHRGGLNSSTDGRCLPATDPAASLPSHCLTDQPVAVAAV